MTLDVDAVRARFSALQRDLVFFDGPGGTQVPDEVIDAIAGYLRESNANAGGPYETSRRTDELVERARATAGRFLGCSPDEVVFGAEHDVAQLRALANGRARNSGRETRSSSPSSTTTRTCRRGSSSPATST